MKTPEEYKQEFLKRASAGYLLKIWRNNKSWYWEGDNSYCEANKIIANDVIWSRESGTKKCHTWARNEFKKILASKPHFKRKLQAKVKRQELAAENKHVRSSHKK